MNRKDLKIVHISDTHGYHEEIDIPGGDILVHTGDYARGSKKFETEMFIEWMSEFPHKHKILVPGNHDWFMERLKNEEDDIDPKGIHILMDSSLELEGYLFHGNSYQPIFFNWAFNLEEEDLIKKWALIPENADVLLTHVPRFGCLDKNEDLILCGSKSLGEKIAKMSTLKLHLFGHIHEDAGDIFKDGFLSVNGSAIPGSRSIRLNPAREILLTDSYSAII